MRSRLAGVVSITALIVPATAAHAQRGTAEVKQAIRVVKKQGTPGTALEDAKVGVKLRSGERLRTGGRSFAGLRFEDSSIIRMGELSEVVVGGGGGRKTEVVRGRVYADFKSPGVISGGYAVAAVRGTAVEYIVDDERGIANVNCYRGEVYVSNPANPVAAGNASEVTRNSLTDATLVGSEANWVGTELEFIEGPYKGQKRKISKFDPRTGTVTFDTALPAPFYQAGGSGVNGFRMAQNLNQVQRLGANQGLQIPRGGQPRAPRTIVRAQFANLERNSNPNQVLAGGGTADTYVGGTSHTETREVSSGGEVVQNDVQTDAGGPPPPEDPCGCGDFFPDPGGKGAKALRRRGIGGLFGSRGMLTRGRGSLASMGGGSGELGLLGTSLAQAGGGGAAGAQKVQPGGLEGFKPEQRQLPKNNASKPADPGTKSRWLFEPFAFASDETEVGGSRLRYQTAIGEAFVELGYRYTNISGASDHDVSEGFVNFRGKNGDLIVGRQHIFLRPSNNQSFGTLLGLDTVDAIVYSPPVKNGQRHQVGYVIDSEATARGGTKGGFARSQFPLAKGTVGYSLFASQDSDSNFGYSFDISQPIIRNKVDAYVEAGNNIRGRRITTAGLYLPVMFHKYGLDTFVEYGRQDGRQELISLRMRRDIGKGLLLLFFVDNSLKDGFFTVGGGALYTKSFK